MSKRQPGALLQSPRAAKQLAALLLPLAVEQPVVIGLPRGGVPVAAEVAAALGTVLEVLAVRKVGAPGNPEYGIGAIAKDGTRAFDREAVAALGIDEGHLGGDRRARGGPSCAAGSRSTGATVRRSSLRDRIAVVVDDGVATGVTDTVALRAARAAAARDGLSSPSRSVRPIPRRACGPRRISSSA